MPSDGDTYNDYDVICCAGAFFMRYNHAWYPFDTAADIAELEKTLNARIEALEKADFASKDYVSKSIENVPTNEDITSLQAEIDALEATHQQDIATVTEINVNQAAKLKALDSEVLHFKGSYPYIPTTNAQDPTTGEWDWESGDVIIVGSYKYIYYDNTWSSFGTQIAENT